MMRSTYIEILIVINLVPFIGIHYSVSAHSSESVTGAISLTSDDEASTCTSLSCMFIIHMYVLRGNKVVISLSSS